MSNIEDINRERPKEHVYGCGIRVKNYDASNPPSGVIREINGKHYRLMSAGNSSKGVAAFRNQLNAQYLGETNFSNNYEVVDITDIIQEGKVEKCEVIFCDDNVIHHRNKEVPAKAQRNP